MRKKKAINYKYVKDIPTGTLVEYRQKTKGLIYNDNNNVYLLTHNPALNGIHPKNHNWINYGYEFSWKLLEVNRVVDIYIRIIK